MKIRITLIVERICLLPFYLIGEKVRPLLTVNIAQIDRLFRSLSIDYSNLISRIFHLEIILSFRCHIEVETRTMIFNRGARVHNLKRNLTGCCNRTNFDNR